MSHPHLLAEIGQKSEIDLKLIAKQSGLGIPFLREAIGLAREKSEADEATLLARLLWLLRNEREQGIDLAAREQGLTPDRLAAHLLSPRDLVFSIIRSKVAITVEALGRIFAHIRHKRSAAGEPQIADLSEERALQEMKWWIADLRFPDFYFKTTPPEEIADQILTNRLYEIQGIDSQSYKDMKLRFRTPRGGWIYWAHAEKSAEVEGELESLFTSGDGGFDLAMYRHENLHLYLVEPSGKRDVESSFEASLPASFLDRVDAPRLARYRALHAAVMAEGRAVAQKSLTELGEHRLMVGFPAGDTPRPLSLLTQALGGISIARKYVVSVSGAHPLILASFYSAQPFPDNLLEDLARVRLLDGNPFFEEASSGALTIEEAHFLHAASRFIHQFLSSSDPAMDLLRQRLSTDRELDELLSTLKRRMEKERYTYSTVLATLRERLDLGKKLFSVFAAAHREPCEKNGASAASFENQLREQAPGQAESLVFRQGLAFVRSILRTNFFLPEKKALCFRLDASFPGAQSLGPAPHGIFFVCGRGFFGFHVRFKEIARGGIRIVHSAHPEEYAKNASTLFEECYQLALTQNRKNKDIPEGGAKGIVLTEGVSIPQAQADACFKDYVESILDLLLPRSDRMIAHWAQEILFLGPDEGSADLMDWACLCAKRRGYPYWKGFTTGKSAALGGISHIDFGMTTQGVHAYVLQILEKLGQKEEEITKVQTGGPDGDLGSNEILCSKDKTLAVIDGAGVLYDPEGLDRGELARLARKRMNSAAFDPEALGPMGFKVGVGDHRVTLPDGRLVASGLSFRNQFHLDPLLRADLFVPCGGRPKSIDSTNVDLMFDATGKPRFRWIVEGANLFITQPARLQLEKRGVILFKDSSTNKGGVISSSLEVLVGLTLSDEEFQSNMVCDASGASSAFRGKYIEEIQATIRRKSKAEFGALWDAREKSGLTFSEASDVLSEAINRLTISIESSTLFNDSALCETALRLHAPEALSGFLGIEMIQERLPASYRRAIIARMIASHFIYRYGPTPGFEEYRAFLGSLARTPSL